MNREPGTLNHAVILVVSLLGAMASAASAHDPSVRAVRVAGRLSEQALLSLAQKQTFRYFWDGAEPTSGMALERIHVGRESSRHRGQVVTTGGSGFGLMALLVGIERGFVSRKAAIERLSKIVAFLEQADRFPGTWPHWLNGETGKVVPFSAKDNGADLVETSYMAQGLLAVRQYLSRGNEAERKLARRIDRLWREIEWDWFRRDGQNVLYWHWSPYLGLGDESSNPWLQ